MDEARWRHAWATFVVGAIAAVALALVAFVVSTQRTEPAARGPILLSEVPEPTGPSPTATAPSSSAPRPTRTAPTPSSTAAPSSSTAPPPHTSPAVARRVVTSSAPAVVRPPAPPPVCPTDAPCAVGGDGGVIAALSRYRSEHGRNPVPGSVSTDAQQCAVSRGDGASCAQPFATAELASQDGARAIANIRSGSGNWLLDPGLDGVAVGWAYHSRAGVWVCALFAS